MTGPRRTVAEPPPEIVVQPVLRTAAGLPVTAHARVTNRAPEPRIIAVSAHGLDAEWLPRPVRGRPVMPGESVDVELAVSPTSGTLPARYPFAVAAQAIDPVSERATSHAALADVTLVVDAPGQIDLAVEPVETSGLLRRRIAVRLRNAGAAAEQVHLEVHSAEAAEVRLSADVVDVPAGTSVTVPGRVKIEPRLFGQRSRYTYTVTARGAGAARHAEASVVTRAFLGANASKAVALTGIVALWAALALLFIPKLSSTIRNDQNKANDKVSGLQNSATSRLAPSKVPGAGGSAGSGGSGGGSGGSGGSGPATANAAAKRVQLSGTVTGVPAGDVRVEMTPTSLVDEEAQNAHPVGIDSATFTEIGKIPAEAVSLATPSDGAQDRRTSTQSDGAWAFAGVRKPGYYLLTFAKPGYQTQRYVIDAAAAVATNPLTVHLVPGQGRLSGHISGPSGAVGGATITISDGTNTLTTSSNSRGRVGDWSVDGLSTPGSYLVLAGKDGLSTESALVTLGAGGTAVRNLRLVHGVATLTGTVRGPDSLGVIGGLGGVHVTASDGNGTVRTASTVTNGNLAGTYILPDLPPGTYTVTTSADGYQPQTQRVTIAHGQSRAVVNASLTSAGATVTGRVTGDTPDSHGKSVPLDAGITLRSAQDTYKITSGPNGFRVNGVSPGSYVVSAEYAGMQTGYHTISVTGGETTVVPTFNLIAQAATSNSSITGFVSDGTNPSGTLCPDHADDCTITFDLHDSAGQAVDVAPASINPPSSSGPTSYTIKGASNGLAPGLYKLTIGVTLVSGSSLAGYLPATVSVQVPLDGIGRAPQVNLFAASTISGTVDSLNGDTTGNGAYTNCVWAIPAGTSAPETCDPPTSSSCLSTGRPDSAVGTIDEDGTYAIGQLCPGTYTMLIVVGNPDFVAPAPNPPPTVSVTEGLPGRWDSQLFRKPRIQLRLTTPDPSTGQAGQLGDTTLTAGSVCGPVDLAGQQLDAAGELLVTGLPKGTVTCTLHAKTPDGVAVSTTSGPVPATLDQTTNLALTLTPHVDAFVGRIVTSWSGTAQPVGGQLVTITGTTGYTNGVADPPRAVQVVSDIFGCFAVKIHPNDLLPDPLPGGCAGDPIVPVVTLPLVVPHASFHMDAQQGFRQLDQADTSVGAGSLLQLNAIPQPVRFSGTLTGGTGLSQATITVTKFPLGTGRLTVVSDGDGALSWTDSSIGTGQQIVPGTYTIRVAAAGFTPWSYTFTCVPGADCVQQFALIPLGELSLTGVPDGAQVTLIRDGTPIGTRTSSGDPVSFSGLIPQFPGSAPTYAVQVRAAGYLFDSSVPVDCGDGSGQVVVTPGATSTCAVTLSPDGTVTVQVNGTSSQDGKPTSTPLTGATVKATLCTDDAKKGDTTCVSATSGNTGPFDATDNGDGTYTITGTADQQGLDPGKWLLTASAPGYKGPVREVVAVAKGSQDADPIGLPIVLVPTFSVTVKNAQGNVVSDGLTVQMLQDGVVIQTATSASGTTYDFADLAPGTYSVQVTGTSIRPQTDDGITISSTQHTHTVFVTVGASTISGTASGQQGADPGTSAMNDVLVQVGTGSGATFKLAVGVDGKDMTTTTPSTGQSAGGYKLTDLPNSPADGWTVRFSKTGYETQDITGVDVDFKNAATTLDATLVRVTHNVDVTLTSTNGFDLDGAQAHLEPVGANPTQAAKPLVAETGHPDRYGTSFPAIPFGSWQVWIELPANHFGAVEADEGTVITKADPLPITVSSSPTGADSSADLTIDEGELDLSVVAKPLASDPTPANEPTTITFAGGGISLDVPVGAASPTQFWVPRATYKIGPLPKNWQSDTLSVTATKAATSKKITLTELGADVTVHVQGKDGKAVPDAEVTLTAPSGITAPGPAQTDSTGDVTFTNLPYGDGWNAAVTSGALTGNHDFAVPATKPVTVTVS